MFTILKSKKAFGLVEVIISTLIMTFIAGVGTGAFTLSKNIIIRTANLIQATAFSEQVLEELIAVAATDTDFDDTRLTPSSNHDTDTELLLGCDFNNSDFKNRYNGRIIYIVSEGNWDTNNKYKEIKVTTTWHDVSEHSISYISIVGARGAR